MSVVRTALFRLIGVALLLALAAVTVWYTVVVPRQRQERFHAAPNPTPTATDATATSVPPPLASPAARTSSDGVVHDVVVRAGACYETHPPATGGADVTPQQRDCSGPHNTVAVSTHTLPDPAGVPFDGTDVPGEAQRLCTSEQDALIDGRPGFQAVTIYPGAGLWGDGDRTVACLVRRDGADVSGSFGG